MTGPADSLLLEYHGPHQSVTLLGRATGSQYRFGKDEGHLRKWVKRADASDLLSKSTNNVPHFVIVQREEPPVIETSGLPKQPAIFEMMDVAPEPDASREKPSEPVATAEPVTVTAMSLREIRGRLPDMAELDIAHWLARERASAAPRSSVVKLLTTALNAAQKLEAVPA